jgi:Pal1 cell morphology protein
MSLGFMGLMAVFSCSVNITKCFIVFHHDGPFDACRPHRNKHSHKAPVAAFPVNSLTNTLAGGLGEVPGLDRDQYFGLRPQEAFQDYGVVSDTRPRRTSDPEQRSVSGSRKDDNDRQKLRPTVGIRSTSFDPRSKTEFVHGVESAGLGTSTFLEGAPAPRSAIEKAKQAEEEENNGLARQKSLVQKMRRKTNGERSPPPPLAGPILPSSNNATSPVLDSSYNPVFKEGQFVENVESVSSPTHERTTSGDSDKGTGGILGRVKSLKISGAKRGRKGDE